MAEVIAPNPARTAATMKLALVAVNIVISSVDLAMIVVKIAPARPTPNTIPVERAVASIPAAMPCRS